MKLKMIMMIDNQYLLGGLVTSLLGFCLFYNSKKKSKKNRVASMVLIRRNETLKTTGNVTFRPEIAGSTDVIIVGVSVAGSALAYTLGKLVFRKMASIHLGLSNAN